MAVAKTYANITCDVIATTEKAVLCAFAEGSVQQCWIPRSVISDGDVVEEDDNLSLDVEEWFVNKEGLEHG
jgi:hypothetical protein